MKQKLLIVVSIALIILTTLLTCKDDEELPDITGGEKISLAVTEDSTSYVFATLSCDLNLKPKFKIEQHGFCWDTLANVTIQKTHSTIGVLTYQEFTNNADNLKPNKTYYVKAYIQNGNVVIYSNELTIHTLDAKPIVTTADISNIKANTASCGGTVISITEFPITQRGICWAKAQNPTITDSLTNEGIGNGSFTCQLSNLEFNTSYYVRAYAINSQGIIYGEQKSFTSKDGIPEITTSDLTDITTNTALGGGSIPDDEGVAITARGVCWSLNQNPTIADNKTIDGAGYGEFTSNLTGLSINTTYYARAYATNANGTTYGTQKTFKTYYGSVTDFDGNEYFTVQIGMQIWMAKNLATTSFNDGSTIPLIADNSTWSTISTPALCWYNNDETNYKNTYGALYNWYTVNSGKLCPTGWHVPTDAEWYTLEIYIDGTITDPNATGWRGTNGGTKLKNRTGWNNNGNGTDDYRFSAMPGSSRTDNGSFNAIGNFTDWWLFSELSSTNARNRGMLYYQNGIYRGDYHKRCGFSVRCIQGEITLSLPTITTNSVGSITSESSVCGGNITSTGNSGIIERGVCWNTSGNPTIADNKTTDGTGSGSFTSNITGLAPNTTYFVKAYATNSVGTAYGAEVSFTTLLASQILDYDGNIYNTVAIGTQVWMTENLKTKHYSDGTALIDGTGAIDISGDYTTKYWFINSEDPNYENNYGLLYTYAAAINFGSTGTQGVCPDGWHVPSHEEWKTLEKFLGMSQVDADLTGWRGTNEGIKLKSTSGWFSDGNGTNESGFTALPGGYRFNYGTYYFLTTNALFWSSTSFNSQSSWYRRINYELSTVYSYCYTNDYAMSVRCVKN
jgi:uncharacterized protein (TIGR02145 family)